MSRTRILLNAQAAWDAEVVPPSSNKEQACLLIQGIWLIEIQSISLYNQNKDKKVWEYS